MSLLDLAIKHKTDKAEHGFCEIYEKHFANRRLERLKVLEIGVYMGGSLRMWREYFPNAEVHGVDINITRCGAVDGVTLHMLDANDTNGLIKFSEQHGPWDIIVDDASHTMKHQQSAFVSLWSHIKPDGFYVIEDLHTSFLPKLESASTDAHNEINVHTTFAMVECLKDGKKFHSKYITEQKLDEIRQSVEDVVIWVKSPQQNTHDYRSNNSMTSMIRKKNP